MKWLLLVASLIFQFSSIAQTTPGLKEYLQPYSSNPKLKDVIIQTLHESGSKLDKAYADELEKK